MTVCGTGTWSGPLPGDPDNTVSLAATPTFGGIDVTWSYPAVNPYAVAHTLLYRGVTNVRASATERAVVAGNHYYDKIETAGTYYYWIRIVSVHGTLGDWIGPAVATSQELSTKIVEKVSGHIDESVLETALRTEIGKITLNYGELLTEISDRLGAESAMSIALADLQDGLVDSVAMVASEITTREDGDAALASQIDVVVAANAANAAAILAEQTARVDEDSAMALDITELYAATDAAAAAVIDTNTTKIGYSAKNDGTSAPYDGDGVVIVYPVLDYPAVDYPDYAVNRTRIIDKVGVTNWNVLVPGTPLVWIAGMPLASAVKKVSVTDPGGGSASLESAFTAQKDLNNNFKALYTAKVTVTDGPTKLIGGFGIYGDATGIEAGFDVDKFWVGRTTGDKVKPFMITDGVTHIKQAQIGTANVATLNIANQAVTFPASAYTAGQRDSSVMDYPALPGFVLAQTLPVTSTGAPALLIFGAHIYCSNHEGLMMQLWREQGAVFGGTPYVAPLNIFSKGPGVVHGITHQIQGEGMETATVVDNPPAGNWVYTLLIGNFSEYQTYVSARCITYIECKR